MKNLIIVLSLSAFMLAGCMRTNQKTDGVGAPDAVKMDMTENVVDEPERIPHVAITALKALAKIEGNSFYLTKESVDNLSEKDEIDGEAHCAYVVSDEEEDVEFTVAADCFPLSDGGYAVIFTKTSGCCLCYYSQYEGYCYKEGVLTEAKELLPYTTIDDFYSNADSFSDEVFNLLANSPGYFWFDNEKNQLVAGFDPYNCTESIRVYLPKPLRGMYLKIDEKFEDYSENEQREAIGGGNFEIFPTIAYHWEGEKFVRDANSKPLEEDLKYFGKFDEFMKTAKSANNLRKGDGCIDLECDLNGDGHPDFVNNDYEWQEFAIYLNDGSGGYNRFGEYECLEGFWISNISFEDGVLDVDVSNTDENYNYKIRFQDGSFCLTDHPKVQLGSFKLGQDPTQLQ